MTQTSTEQPESVEARALRLVLWLDKMSNREFGPASESARLIESLHARVQELEGRIEELEALLFAIGAGGVEPVEDGLIQEGSLLYRLTDERRPSNRDEINVTMANGSRTEEARTRRAGELLDAIRTAAEIGKAMQ